MLDAALAVDDIAGIALAGLTATPKTLPPKLFYDEQGVRLFEAITRLPEYYLTRTELALLDRIAPELAALASPGAALVEYGASDETKARKLLDAPGARFAAYVPIDVARAALDALAARLAAASPGLSVRPVCADFLEPLHLPDGMGDAAPFGFFPGSTIGNLDPHAASGFLRQARQTLGAGAWLVVGVDLRKDPSLLVPAYDDAQGVTAQFNLNLLRRLNREAGADFELAAFRHEARWNGAESRIEMHLVSRRRQSVRVAGHAIGFAAGESIHTENSYKYGAEAFQAIAATAGWQPVRVWTDAASLFSVHALRAG